MTKPLSGEEARLVFHWRLRRGTHPPGTDMLTKLRSSAHRRQARITRVLRSVKATVGCIDCGFTDPRALQWDHIEPSSKLGNVGGMGNWSWTWREMEKCAVRCANCHAIRTHEEGHTKTNTRQIA